MGPRKNRVAWVILIGCFLAFNFSCADPGHPIAQSPKEIPIQDSDDSDPDEIARPLFFEPDLLKSGWDRGESCLAADTLVDIFSDNSNGWSTELPGSIELKLHSEENGLWLQLVDPENLLEHAVVELELSRLRLDAWVWLETTDVISLRWSADDVLIRLANGWQSMRDSSLVSSWKHGQEQGLFLANILADTALASIVWGLELRLVEGRSRLRRIGHWYFQGSAPVWKGLLTSQRCQFQQPDFHLETVEIWDESSNDPKDQAVFAKLLSINRTGLIDAILATRALQILPLSVPVLVVPPQVKQQWQGLKPGARLIDRSMASSQQIQVRQEMLIYQDAFYFMIHRILMESLSSQQNLWTQVIAWALTDIHLLEQRGLYEQVIFLNRSLEKLDTDVFHPRQLAHILSHRFSKSQLIISWQKCRNKIGSDFQACLLEALFGKDQPTEMAGWLWQGSDFHPDWHPDLVSDADGDGLVELLERRHGTDPRLVDTDDDGWSDFAEAIHDSDGRSPVSHPPGITVDGWFDDWIRLLPHKVKARPDKQVSNCSDLSLLYFSGFRSSNWLLLGGKLINPNAQVRWEVNFDFAGNHSNFFVSLESGRRHIHIQREASDPKEALLVSRPFQNQPTDMEILLEADWLKRLLRAANEEADDFDLSQELSAKIAVYLGDGEGNWQFCEDTPWFIPSAVNVRK